jgi:hypothetical protein
MRDANPLWGAPRIHGELQKLGIDVSQATVAKYLGRRGGPPSQSWRTFLTNHVSQLASIDNVLTAPRSPWQSPFVERVIGSLRWECLDHVIVGNERPLRRHLRHDLARNVPSSAAFPLMPSKPVTSPTAKRPGMTRPDLSTTRQSMSTSTPPMLLRVRGKNWGRIEGRRVDRLRFRRDLLAKRPRVCDDAGHGP